MRAPQFERISREVVREFEGDGAPADGAPAHWRPDPEHVSNYMREGEPRFARLSELTRKAAPPGSRVLEVGAAYGATLLDLKEAGYEVAATDIEAGIQAFCVPLLSAGIEVRAWDLHGEDGPYEPESFDVVICAEVLEHLQMSLVSAVRKLGGQLKPGGTLLVSSPNLYRAANLGRVVAGRSIIEPFPDTPNMLEGRVLDDQREHPREPTRRELVESVEAAGLKVETVTGFNAVNSELSPLMRGALNAMPRRMRQFTLVGAVKP